jgi:hypothetical protein
MGDGMIAVGLIVLWYCALVVLFALFVTGGHLGGMGIFAAGFGMCILGIAVAVVMSAAEISGRISRDEENGHG